MNGTLYAGVDIGGTKLLTLIADAKGTVLAEVRLPTRASADPREVLDDAVRTIESALAEAGRSRADLSAVGLAIAGPVDFKRGVVTSSPNLPEWRDVPAVTMVSAALGLPAVLENDANAAALGELHFGAARGLRHVVYLTVSTGIGGGIIIDGRLYRGASGSAGEFGHMVLDPGGPVCGCGNRGCFETLASGTAIAREGSAAAARGESPALARLAAEQGELTAEDIAEAAEAGDAVAAEIVARAADFFGIGLAAIVNALNPESIIIGGGVSKMGDRYLGPAEAAMRAHAFDLPAGAVSLRQSVLGDHAAALGAVALVSGSSGRVS